MTAEEEEKMGEALKEGMAKVQEENQDLIETIRRANRSAAQGGIDNLKGKAQDIASEIKANFKADEGTEGAEKAKACSPISGRAASRARSRSSSPPLSSTSWCVGFSKELLRLRRKLT